MAKFRKIPVEIEAVRLKKSIIIPTLEGNMLGRAGSWLVTGVNGEQYAVKHDIFVKTYTPSEGTDDPDYFRDRKKKMVKPKTTRKCKCK